MKNNRFNTPSQSGFSLVEVVLAMGIAAVALVSLIGFLPQAMQGASDGADQTAIGLMLEDIHDRMEGAPLKETNQAGVIGSPFFYDQGGAYIDPDIPTSGQVSILNEPFYRVEVNIVKPLGQPDGVDLGDALTVKVDLYWPINQGGEAVNPEEPNTSITYFTAARTGPAWEVIDPQYEPKIEY